MTGASTTEMKGWHDGRLEVRVAAPPEAGRANDQVTRVLADRLGVPVELASGTSARDKVFLARHIEVEEVWGKLSR